MCCLITHLSGICYVCPFTSQRCVCVPLHIIVLSTLDGIYTWFWCSYIIDNVKAKTQGKETSDYNMQRFFCADCDMEYDTVHVQKNFLECSECGGFLRNWKKNKLEQKREEEKKEVDENEEEKPQDGKKKLSKDEEIDRLVSAAMERIFGDVAEREKAEIHRKWFEDDDA